MAADGGDGCAAAADGRGRRSTSMWAAAAMASTWRVSRRPWSWSRMAAGTDLGRRGRRGSGRKGGGAGPVDSDGVRAWIRQRRDDEGVRACVKEREKKNLAVAKRIYYQWRTSLVRHCYRNT